MDKINKDKIDKYFQLFNKITSGGKSLDLDDPSIELNELWETLTNEEKSAAYDKVAPLRRRLKSKSKSAQSPKAGV